MKKKILIIWCFSIIATLCGCLNDDNIKTQQAVQNQIETNISEDNKFSVTTDTLFHADLIYHVFNYIDLKDSPANLYSQDYINDFEEFRAKQNNTNNLIESTKKLSNAYAKYFDEVNYIAFCSFSYSNYDDMKDAILNDKSVSEEAKSQFVIPFMQCIDNEKELYHKYWDNKIKESKNYIDEFEKFSNDKNYNLYKVFAYTNKRPHYFLCVSLNGKGRGIWSIDKLTAAVEIPKTKEEMNDTYYQAFHEMTHQLTDKKFFSAINMKDGTHSQSEKVVMITDYYIFKEQDPNLLKPYIEWTAKQAGVSDVTEQDFLNFYKVTEEQELEIKSLVKEIGEYTLN